MSLSRGLSAFNLFVRFLVSILSTWYSYTLTIGKIRHFNLLNEEILTAFAAEYDHGEDAAQERSSLAAVVHVHVAYRDSAWLLSNDVCSR